VPSIDINPNADAEGEEELPSPVPTVEYIMTMHGRRITKKSYIESKSERDPVMLDGMFAEHNKPVGYRGNEDDEKDIGPQWGVPRPNKR
jgi:hypothetical protein